MGQQKLCGNLHALLMVLSTTESGYASALSKRQHRQWAPMDGALKLLNFGCRFHSLVPSSFLHDNRSSTVTVFYSIGPQSGMCVFLVVT